MNAINNEPVFEAAKYYIERLGFGLCAIPPGTKGPRTTGWNTKPSLFIDTAAKAQHQIKPNYGTGVIHAASNTCALDVDHLEYACIMFEEFGLDLDQILRQGLRITSGRENRAKAVFRVPSILRNPSRRAISWPDKDDPSESVTVIEFRAGNTQDVLPPSIHMDTGKPYEWLDAPWDNNDEIPELPDSIAQIWANWDKLSLQLKAACPWDNRKHDPSPAPIQRNSDQRSNSVIQAFNDAHDIAAMLENYGYQRRSKKRFLAPNSSTKLPGVILLDEEHFFSHHASDIFGDGKRHDAFDMFCAYECGGNFSNAVAKAANLLGIQQQPEVGIDVSLLIENAKKQPVKVQVKNKSIPDALLSPPNILKPIVDQILATAQRPQPVFAVNAALCLMGTLLARKVQDECGSRTNLYLVSLGPTGCGKEHGRKYVKNMLDALGCSSQIAGEDIASGQGLMARAGMSPDAVFQIDEFGDFLAAATDKNSASHKVGILTNFMKLYSSADSVITGAEYANQKMNERQLIEYPCVTLHGTGTDGVFYDALKGRHILDGYLNRMLVTQTDTPRPARQRTRSASTPCDDLSKWHETFQAWLGRQGGNLMGLNPKQPATVRRTQEAWDLFDAFEDRIDEQIANGRDNGLDALYVRSVEHASKLALILGASKEEPLITDIEARWAIDFVSYWTERLAGEAMLRIADSEFGSLMNLVLQQIVKAGEEGLTHGRTFNHKKLREVQPMMRQQIIAALAENGEIKVLQTKNEGAGRPSMRYVSAQYSNS